MSKVPARWNRLERIVELRHELSPETLILGNGDVLSRADALSKVAAAGADGAMVGRALFGNPWFFHPTRQLPVHLTALPTKGVNRETLYAEAEAVDGITHVTLPERLRVMVEHSYRFEELLGFKNFNIMKKHYKAYVNSFPRAAELRAELMEEAGSAAEVEAIVERFLAAQK
jgi:tRNA-dihydrouridine synthase